MQHEIFVQQASFNIYYSTKHENVHENSSNVLKHFTAITHLLSRRKK